MQISVITIHVQEYEISAIKIPLECLQNAQSRLVCCNLSQ